MKDQGYDLLVAFQESRMIPTLISRVGFLLRQTTLQLYIASKNCAALFIYTTVIITVSPKMYAGSSD